MEISDNMKEMMEDLESGDAFDKALLTKLSSMDGEWSNLISQQDNLFGKYSPIRGCFEGLADSNPLTLEDIDEMELFDRDGAPITLTDEQKEALVDRPRGVLTMIRGQAESQFNDLVDNMTLYSSNQRVQTALGNSNGCGALGEHFGTITDFGNRIADNVTSVENAINDYKMLKTQVQSEIDAFDDNVINFLTGRVNGTIIANLVRGSGLHDQIDGILQDAGIANDSNEAAEIRAEIGSLLDQHSLNNLFAKKTKANEEVAKLDKERGGIIGQIGKEVVVFDKALTTLRKLGAANSVSGLFKTNECIQTLMGFVATTPFLNKLGKG